MTNNITLEQLMKIAYPTESGPYKDEYFEGYYAKYKDLPVEVYGLEDSLELKKDLEDAKEEYFATALKEGLAIPAPSVKRDEPTGKTRFTMRVGRSLHQRISNFAEGEGLSLNTAAISLLERGLAAEDNMKLQQSLTETLSKMEKHSDKFLLAINNASNTSVSSTFIDKTTALNGFERSELTWN